MQNDIINIRKFVEDDIDNKIKWINDSNNNKFLHYDLPLVYNKTFQWYQKIKKDVNRYDGIIEYNTIPIGIIGLLNIDYVNKKAEFYITIGEQEYKNKGIAKIATKKFLDLAIMKFEINKIYSYIEKENIPSIKLLEKTGFIQEGLLHKDLIINGKEIDRYVYAYFK